MEMPRIRKLDSTPTTEPADATYLIDGDVTTAHVMGIEDVEDELLDQVLEVADCPAFQNPIRMQPDSHFGAGAPIGFTTQVTTDPLRVVPNVIGRDIGCGVRAECYGELDPDAETLERMDEQVREAVPMGRSVHSDTDYHIVEDFPWTRCGTKLDDFRTHFVADDVTLPAWFDGYGKEYVQSLSDRVGYDLTRAINSVGTLGGGNHFIEFGRATGSDLGDDPAWADDTLWCTIHSGSRGLGGTIAGYWQDRATTQRTNEWIRSQLDDELTPYVVPDLDDPALAQWFQGGMGRSYIDSDAIREAVTDNELIGYLHDRIREAHPQERDATEALDWLDGDLAMGYVIDMLFAQTYAQENRRRMHVLVRDAVTESLTPTRTIESVHNYIDPDDGFVRKGACSAHTDEWVLVPFNMADGLLIVRGNGDPDWNLSAPHGAGRRMSRTQAYDEVDMDAFEDRMADVVSSSVTEDTKDEAPTAYKDAETISDAIASTGTIYSRVGPVLNIKADE